MSPNGYDIWDVNSAAGKLVGQAHTVSARHLSHSIPRVQFNREVAYYAKRIADDVALGRKTPEQGMQAILQEQRNLLDQSLAVARKGQEAITHAVKRIPLMRLTRPVLQPDPGRLLRFVHAQHLKTLNPNARSTLTVEPPPSPLPESSRFFPREQWPASIQVHEPGFYVVPKSTTADKLEAQLFTSRNPAVIAKFKTLNPYLDQVKAGQLIVLSDPNNLRCTREEAYLMAAAEKVNTALQTLTPEEADFMARHRDEIESFLKHGSTSIGTGVAVFDSNLDSVKNTLRDIEALHQSTFLRDGHLRSPEFFVERKRLFGQLDTHLTRFTKKSIGFPDHPNLKSALGISNRSLVHRWTKAGAPDQIPGYATHMDGIAKAAKYVKYGGWLGTAIGGGASYIKIQDVCGASNTEACKKVKFTETGSFAGGVAGGAAVGLALTGSTAAAMCVALGVPTGGLATLACGVVVVGAGSFVSGTIGGALGEEMGEVVYEAGK
ncbi:hypothetical protein [Pseudomonas mucidolens]|uniref:LysM domain-containing protein n=1 Tax=Pseudomonas mucidolens TaxID=46679 RepID=A0A1H2P5J4_9PSED|nr:hypothetical protein [Pseudomonas mucidolens]SDV12266.1 hypothetical protein SAMN05216202_5460 [Pseudomonas mucidolens]SQH36295.1 LysM domain-containing protein [Pseudomonas mucidolens]